VNANLVLQVEGPGVHLDPAAVVNLTDTRKQAECMFPPLSGPKYIVKCIVVMCRDTQKATNQGWGDETTAWESAEPIAEADRNEEKKEAGETTTVPTPAAKATEEPVAPAEPEKEPEPEDNTLTYAEWLAAKAADKSDYGAHPIRQTDQSKWASAQSVISKKDRAVDDNLFGEATTGGQKTRSVSTSAKKAPKKVIIEIEQRFTPLRSDRRGGDRGGRGGKDAQDVVAKIVIVRRHREAKEAVDELMGREVMLDVVVDEGEGESDVPQGRQRLMSMIRLHSLPLARDTSLYPF